MYIRFGLYWTGVYDSDEIPPSVGYSIQITRPRTTRGVGHWLARANDVCYSSFGRVEYLDTVIRAVMLNNEKIRIVVVKCVLRGSVCTTISVRSLLGSCRTKDMGR